MFQKRRKRRRTTRAQVSLFMKRSIVSCRDMEIDRAAQFGGALSGNGCQKLMAEADAIMKEIGDYVFQLPVEQRLVGTRDEILLPRENNWCHNTPRTEVWGQLLCCSF
jgi:hypothetical protein